MTYIRFPFAEGGDRDEVPTEAQVDNSISFQEGYPVEYEQDPATNASARRLERRLFNGLMNRLSTELQQYQQFGFPEFITSGDNGGSAFPYSLGAFVRYNPGSGVRVYRSLASNNTALPTVTANWLDTGSYITQSSLSSTLSNYATSTEIQDFITESDIPTASTSQPGISQLNTSISSTSTDQAATPSAVRSAYNLASQANTTANTVSAKIQGDYNPDAVATTSDSPTPIPNLNSISIVSGGIYKIEIDARVSALTSGAIISNSNGGSFSEEESSFIAFDNINILSQGASSGALGFNFLSADASGNSTTIRSISYFQAVSTTPFNLTFRRSSPSGTLTILNIGYTVTRLN